MTIPATDLDALPLFTHLSRTQRAAIAGVSRIETYEDALFGYKAAHEGVVLIKDRDWSQRLAKYASLLPGLKIR